MESFLIKAQKMKVKAERMIGSKILFYIRRAEKNVLSRLKEFWKNSFFCLSTKKKGSKLFVFVILFIFTSIGIRAILLAPDNQEGFSFEKEKELSSQSLFLSSIEKNLIETPDFLLINQNVLQAGSPPIVFSPRVLGALIGVVERQDRNAIVEYVVETGDSLWSIANKFNISIDTVIWANDLKETIIRPGQRLIILPVSGVRHIVREGDTLGAIAGKYGDVKIDEIISFNNLSDDGSVFVGQNLIIPGGTKPSTISATISADVDITTLTPKQVRAKFSTNNYWGQSHSFPFGQCTWWVAQKRPIPAWGNANAWLPNAEATGFFGTCRGRHCIPRLGAVIVVRGNPIFGHVAYVENVRGNKITFSEMNNIDWGRINTRTIRIGDPTIIGYIF